MDRKMAIDNVVSEIIEKADTFEHELIRILAHGVVQLQEINVTLKRIHNAIGMIGTTEN